MSAAAAAGASDPVERALAAAIAALAARLGAVPPGDVAALVVELGKLASELTARRTAREADERAERGNVVALRGRR